MSILAVTTCGNFNLKLSFLPPHWVCLLKVSSENTEDDFAFGIDKLLSNEVYSAAYPVHDGLIEEKGNC